MGLITYFLRKNAVFLEGFQIGAHKNSRALFLERTRDEEYLKLFPQ